VNGLSLVESFSILPTTRSPFTRHVIHPFVQGVAPCQVPLPIRIIQPFTHTRTRCTAFGRNRVLRVSPTWTRRGSEDRTADLLMEGPALQLSYSRLSVIRLDQGCQMKMSPWALRHHGCPEVAGCNCNTILL